MMVPVRTWSLLGLFLILCVPAAAQRERSTVLLRGTRFETKATIVDSGKPGPVVMIVGGMHGNEPSGAHAAEEIRHWPITRGRIVVLPRANVPALDADQRRIPGVPREKGDLNRHFPMKKRENPTSDIARAIWKLVTRENPEWLLDLHEGYDFTRINPKSVGSSLIASSSPEIRGAANSMLNAVNQTIEEGNKKFPLKGPPVARSLARGAHVVLGIKSMILETTTKEQPLSRRIRQHRTMVARFFRDRNMLKGTPGPLGTLSGKNKLLRVGIYDAGGVGAKGPPNLAADLAPIPGVVIRRIGRPEIISSQLEGFDVVVFPGGSGSGQSQALGQEGLESVRRFIRNGGGYCGFCAGAYLASSNYDWSLKILDANVIDRSHWKRGTGKVRLEMTSNGRTLLGSGGEALGRTHYANGPILQAAEIPGIPDFAPLAFYRTEINKVGAPKGVMKDTPAIVAGYFGKGRVLCSSPHPEATDGLEKLVQRAVLWASGRDFGRKLRIQ